MLAQVRGFWRAAGRVLALFDMAHPAMFTVRDYASRNSTRYHFTVACFAFAFPFLLHGAAKGFASRLDCCFRKVFLDWKRLVSDSRQVSSLCWLALSGGTALRHCVEVLALFR